MQGLGNATETEGVPDQAHGGWLIPRLWSWETRASTYDITFAGKGGETQAAAVLADRHRQHASCATEVITWKAKRLKRH